MLDRTIKTVGLLGLTTGPAWSREDEAPAANELIARAVNFLRPRQADDGGLRSYAGMTYAGLKSMIHAGLTPDDPRVKATYAYINKYYTLDENPGLGQSGLYYYYHTFAKAMALVGQLTVIDGSGKAHDWRAELVAALAKRQGPTGGWVNPADRFMEGDPNVVTSFALLALHSARPTKE